MKIKSIMRVISASITLLVFFMFLFIGCSKDDANDETDALNPARQRQQRGHFLSRRGAEHQSQ